MSKFIRTVKLMSKYIFVANIFEYSNILVTLWCESNVLMQFLRLAGPCLSLSVRRRKVQASKHKKTRTFLVSLLRGNRKESTDSFKVISE